MKILIILLVSLVLCGCEVKKEIKTNPNTELKDILLEDNYIIVDVRTEEEYEEGHLKHALNIPYDEINENTKLDKDKVVLIYCKSGNRSSMAEDILINLGYKVHNLGAFDNINLPKE